MKPNDRYMDLPALSEYSCIGKSTLREYITGQGLPAFKLKGKILVRMSEFDAWVGKFRIDNDSRVQDIVNDVMSKLNA